MSEAGHKRTRSATRAQRARDEPLSAEKIAPGMYEVSNLRSDSTYVVDMLAESPVCECPDYRYRCADAGEDCKHLSYIRQIADGGLCSWCGYSTCRPSCPYKESDR